MAGHAGQGGGARARRCVEPSVRGGRRARAVSPPPRQGPARLAWGFVHAGHGLSAALKTEAAFRVELVTLAAALPLALWLGQTPAERALLAGVAALVPLVELVNAAIEAAVDHAGTECHPLAGRAKDLGAAALLWSLLLAGVVWVVVLAT